MITWFIFVFLAIVVVVTAFKAKNAYNYYHAGKHDIFSREDTAKDVWITTACLTGFVLGILFIVTFVLNVTYYTEAVNIDRKVELYLNDVDRRDELGTFINAELSEYPGYEERIMTSFDPQILLNFPELRSSEVLQNKVAQIVALNNTLFDARAVIINECANIKARKRNIYIPLFPGLPSCDEDKIDELPGLSGGE